MAQIDIEILTPFAQKFMEGTSLTPAERAEVLRIAQPARVPARQPRMAA